MPKYDYKYTNATYIINVSTNSTVYSTQENSLNDELPLLNQQPYISNQVC